MGERTRLIEEIIKCKGYSIALFTTFNFEIEYFERAILGRLYDNGVRKISVFVDADEFEKSLKSIDAARTSIGLGKKYIVSPVSIHGAFHPKMVLLLGKRKARLIVASSNITTNGYEKHNEVYNVIDYTEKDTTYLNVIVAAIDSFVAINKISYSLDDDLIKEITDFVYYRKCPNNGERFLLTNCEENILEQVKEIIEEPVTCVKIAVPYYDNKTAALNSLQTTFPDAEINLYVQQGTSTLPKEYSNNFAISLFDKFTDTDLSGNSNFYHGKVFLFKADKKDYILYGSANCTVSALRKTHVDGGNVEADILDVGEPREFDQFFDNMHVVKGEELSSKKMTYEPQGYCPLRFISAEMVKEGINCVLKISGNEESIELSYGENVFAHTVKDGMLLFQIEKDVAENMPMLFDLSAQCSSGNYNIHCWIIDRFTLGTNRNDTSDKNILDDFDINADGEKFRNDRFNILKAMIMCKDDYQEYIKMKAYLNQQKIMDEEDDESESDEGFIVDSEFQYEYHSAYKKYGYVERVRDLFLQRFLNPIVFHEDNKDESEHGNKPSSNNDRDYERITTKPRKPTNEEQRFEHFVKKRIKGIFNQEFVASVSVEHYLGIAIVIVEIFEKYKNVAMFEVEYVVNTKIQLIMNLLKKETSRNGEESEFKEHLVVWALCIILQNRELIKLRADISDYKLISADKELLEYLDANYGIRERLDELVSKAADKTYNLDYETIMQNGIKYSANLIDSYYGYKTEKQLFDLIKNRYGENAEIVCNATNICIETETDDMANNLKPDLEVVREIACRMRNVKSTITKVVITITNNNKGTNKQIVRITHTLTLGIYKRWSKTIEYTDGRKENTFSQTY